MPAAGKAASLVDPTGPDRTVPLGLRDDLPRPSPSAARSTRKRRLDRHRSILLIALGTAAAHAGHSVRYVLASKLVNELAEAADEKQLSKTIARYGRLDLLLLDELGYMELDRHGAELLFQVLTEREESPPSRSHPTSRSPTGPRPSPTRGSAPPSSTGSRSTARSSRPAREATAWPKVESVVLTQASSRTNLIVGSTASSSPQSPPMAHMSRPSESTGCRKSILPKSCSPVASVAGGAPLRRTRGRSTLATTRWPRR
jgi:hypothetical protein